MNRRILLQVTAPAMVIGLLLLGAALAGVWYTNRLQRNLTTIRRESQESVKVAQDLENKLRQLRYHCFLYLMDPSDSRLQTFEDDQRHFEEAFQPARSAPRTAQELECLDEIEHGYDAYRREVTELRAEVLRTGKPVTFQRLADQHPLRIVAPWCERLSRISEERMDQVLHESDNVSRQAQLAMLFLGICGPISGLLVGYGIARGLSRSIYQLSVRVQDVAQRLDQDVAAVTIAADGDLQHVDRQLQQVVQRVEEVAERVQRQQRDMLRAEQLSAVGQLAASVAHEVRNPLTSVKLLVEAALRGRDAQDLTREDLTVIHGEVVRLEQTVQSFLNFARLPTPCRRMVDLRDVVAQSIELVRARARQQNVAITTRAPEKAVCVNVDQGQISTVLINLFLNALDAMPRGGRLNVNLDLLPKQTARLAIRDTGAGIPAEMMDRLFTPFASSKPTGTGLGLSISRRILEEHGGRISASNASDGGACFTISLAICAGPESNEPASAEPGAEMSDYHADAVGR
jgi:two-component system, NtrC family, sensor histidine kinase HydH